MTDSQPIALRLRNGMYLPLPKLPDLREFALDGNCRKFTQFLAFHDDTTKTGALYYFATCAWHLHQPAERELFWQQCQLLDALTPAEEVAFGMTGAAPSDATQH